MKCRGSKFFVLWALLALATQLSCMAPIEESSDDSGDTYTPQALKDLDEGEARTLWQFYVEQGLRACDPPPDPWHPFVRYGFCGAQRNVENEAIPAKSYDD